MWYVIETIQLILYILLACFSIAAFVNINQKIEQNKIIERYYTIKEEDEDEDIPNLKNVAESEIFPKKHVPIKKGFRLLSGEKIYLNEEQLAAVLGTIQCENEISTLQSYRQKTAI